MLIQDKELIRNVAKLIIDGSKSITLVSAFLKKEVLSDLIDSCHGKSMRVYARWSILDLVLGVSDLEVYELCKDSNIDFHINNHLHAKAIFNDKGDLILGSSNYTLSGTGQGRRNIEWNAYSHKDLSEIKRIEQSLSFSTLMTDELYFSIKEKVDQYEEEKERLQELTNTPAIRPAVKELSAIRTAETAPFDFALLPFFEPKDLNPRNKKHRTYLMQFGIESIDDLSKWDFWLLNNPLATLINDEIKIADGTLRWGQIQDAILGADGVFESYSNYEQLKAILEEDYRLENYMRALAELVDEYYFRITERDGERRGTCSLNLRL